MATIDRLRALVRGTGERPPVEGELSPPRRELTYEPVDVSGLPFDPQNELPALEGASFVETPIGRTVAVDRVFAADEWHGRARIDRAVVAREEFNALLHSAWQGSDETPAALPVPEPPIVFLDLETTGLSGGAGTVAFLVGLGWFEAGTFRTRQFLLPGFGGERALLTAAADVLAAAAGLVTYNGKTFDLPVMETRSLFQRMSPPWDELPHLDLLHLARRLWGRREDGGAMAAEAGCRLVALEHDLLGVERVGDVPGWEIPARYFEYVRRGHAGVLAPVLHHNRLDLVSLACLTARAARLIGEGPALAADGCEIVALGREYGRRGDEGKAEGCFRQALARHDVRDGTRAEAMYGLARILRRRRQHAPAAEIWHELAASNAARGQLRHEAKEALAVHYEHRARDLRLADRWAREAVDLSTSARQRAQLARRLSRLDRKISESIPPPGVVGLPLDAN